MRAELCHRAEQLHGRISKGSKKAISSQPRTMATRTKCKKLTPVASLFDLGLGFKGLGGSGIWESRGLGAEDVSSVGVHALVCLGPWAVRPGSTA